MERQKPIAKFTMKDWKNVGIFFMLLGLVAMFIVKEWKLGGGIFAVGLLFTGIFQGPKLFKILKKKNW